MRTLLKIFLTIVALIIGSFIIAIVKEATGQGHSSGNGPLGFIVLIATGGAIRAIWKYNPASEASVPVSRDTHKLDKK
jgi:hypothetical protein